MHRQGCHRRAQASRCIDQEPLSVLTVLIGDGVSFLSSAAQFFYGVLEIAQRETLSGSFILLLCDLELFA